MNIEELYSLGRVIPTSKKDKNKYTWLAYRGLLEIRYFDVNDIMKKKTPINGFVSEHGSVLLIPNIINGKLVDLTVKALDSKSMIKYCNHKLPYGLGSFKNFTYGKPIILVEGVADLAGLKLIDPSLNVVALRTNSISQDFYEIYKSLTNKIILLLDNDKAGQSQISKIQFQLKREGIDSEVIRQHASLKDTGEIVDLFMKYEKTKDPEILNELQNINTYYKGQLNLLN